MVQVLFASSDQRREVRRFIISLIKEAPMSARAEDSLPSRAAVVQKLEDLLADRISRETAAAWARPFALGEVGEPADVDDMPAWDALSSIAMCATKDPKHGEYLYNKVSFRSWLEELRVSPK